MLFLILVSALLCPSLLQKRVILALSSDRRQRAVPRDHDRLVGQLEHLGVQRAQDLLVVAPGQVGASNRSGKERVAGNQLLLRREVKTERAFGVPRRQQNLARQPAGSDLVA